MMEPEPGIGVDDLIIPAGELARRPSRPPDHAAEARALAALSEAMATSPERVLQHLAETVLHLTRSDSAGLSILEQQDGTPILRWRAIAGALAGNLNGTMPPTSSPCGMVMSRNQVLLFNEAERCFPDLREVRPRIYESLLAPFEVGGKPAGTVWVVKHTPEGRFEPEDARLLARIAHVASAAYQMTTALAEAKPRPEELERRIEERTRTLMQANERLRESEDRPAFLLALSDALRSLATPADIVGLASRRLGERLGVSRVCYGEIVGKTLRIERDYACGVSSIVGDYSLGAFDREFLAAYRPGEIVVVSDVEADRRLGSAARSELRSRSIAAFADLTLMGDNRQVSILAVQHASPRAWTQAEELLIREVGERVRSALERAHAELALRESEARLRLALSAGEMGTWQYRIEADSNILDPSMARLMGLSPGVHAVGLEAFLRVIHDEDRDQVRAEFESCLHEGREIEVEFRVVWPDGSVRWLKDRGRAILDSNGRPLFLTGAAMDITERRWAEAALRESEARLRLAQEVTGIGTWEWDPDTGENLWMPEKYALFGLDPARDGPMTYTRLLDEVVHPDDRAKVEAALGEALATGGPYECVFRAYRRRPDGEQETCWIIARGRRIPRANGAPGRMLGVTVDITERQATEARLQKLQAELLHVSRLSAAGEMAAALAHELNQPLTAIASAIGAARRILASAFPSGSQQKAEAELRAAMDFAAEQALRGGQIVRRLRDFVTRGEADQRLQDTGKLIEEAGALALVGTRESGIEASFRFAPQLPPVRVDRIQIQQVLLNLIRNAIEAMTQEGAAAEAPRRELVVAAVPTGAGEVEVSVADTGPGLPLEVADRLFEPFVTTKPDGMGVGLSICRTIVEAHGGRLWAEPNPGGGTVFRFRLPVVLSDRVA